MPKVTQPQEPHEAFRDLIDVLNDANHGLTRVELTALGSEWQGGKFKTTLVGGCHDGRGVNINPDLDAVESDLRSVLEENGFAICEDGFQFGPSDSEEYDGMYEATLTLRHFPGGE